MNNHRLGYYLLIIIILIVVFQKSIEKVLFNGLSTPINELIAISTLASCALIQLNKSKLKLSILNTSFILGFLLFIFLSIVVGKNKNIYAIFIQSFLHFQFFIILPTFFSYSKHPKIKFYRIFHLVVVISLFGLILQIIAPNYFAEFFPANENTLEKFSSGIRRFWGFQLNPNALATLLALYLFLMLVTGEFSKNKLLVLLCSIGVILTGSRSALIFVFLGVLFSKILSLRLKSILLITTLVPLFLFGILDNQIEKTNNNFQSISQLDDTRYIRWLMAYKGLQISFDSFPFGTGAATFGTTFSTNSPVYSEVGLSNLPSIQEGSGIHDSNFGSISGEFGFIGLIFFYGFSFLLLKRIIPESSKYKHIVRLFWLIIFASSLFRSFFLSTYYSVVFAVTILSFKEIISTNMNEKSVREN